MSLTMTKIEIYFCFLFAKIQKNKNMGYDSRSIFDFVDKEKMADDLSSSEGLGSMNPYNNDYDNFWFNDKEYVIMQTNG